MQVGDRALLHTAIQGPSFIPKDLWSLHIQQAKERRMK